MYPEKRASFLDPLNSYINDPGKSPFSVEKRENLIERKIVAALPEGFKIEAKYFRKRFGYLLLGFVYGLRDALHKCILDCAFQDPVRASLLSRISQSEQQDKYQQLLNHFM